MHVRSGVLKTNINSVMSDQALFRHHLLEHKITEAEQLFISMLLKADDVLEVAEDLLWILAWYVSHGEASLLLTSLTPVSLFSSLNFFSKKTTLTRVFDIDIDHAYQRGNVDRTKSLSFINEVLGVYRKKQTAIFYTPFHHQIEIKIERRENIFSCCLGSSVAPVHTEKTTKNPNKAYSDSDVDSRILLMEAQLEEIARTTHSIGLRLPGANPTGFFERAYALFGGIGARWGVTTRQYIRVEGSHNIVRAQQTVVDTRGLGAGLVGASAIGSATYLYNKKRESKLRHMDNDDENNKQHKI